MCFISNGFQTIYYLCKELHIRCCRVSVFVVIVFSGNNRFIVSLINLGFFEITINTTRGINKKGNSFAFTLLPLSNFYGTIL